MDGINEHGLMVAISGLKEKPVGNPEGKKKIFITYLIRKLLDHTKTVAEAVRLADQFVPFDLDQDVLNGHLFIADAFGQSVVLEYVDNQWQKITSEESWQVLSTKPVYNVPEIQRRNDCWRYNTMGEALEIVNGRVNLHSGMQILQDVHQIGTTWSVIYMLSTREIYFTVYQDWDEVYYIKPF
jgi:predicted choloylglycine hydrolase